MAGESDDLDKLFESVADGESVDWDALEREAPDEETRALIHQLRLIAEVAEVHRSQVDEVGLSEDVALTGPPAGAAACQFSLRVDDGSGPISAPLREALDPREAFRRDHHLRRTTACGAICSWCARLVRVRTVKSFTRTTRGSTTPLP